MPWPMFLPILSPTHNFIKGARESGRAWLPRPFANISLRMTQWTDIKTPLADIAEEVVKRAGVFVQFLRGMEIPLRSSVFHVLRYSLILPFPFGKP
jgi:hypothetical protein